MPRRAKIIKREILPDGKYQSRTVTMFVNKLMERGKKGLAERIFYNTVDELERRAVAPQGDNRSSSRGRSFGPEAAIPPRRPL